MADGTDGEIDRLWSETRRLDAETAHLLAKERKSAAEELHLQHQYHLPPWVTILLWTAVGAGLAQLLFSLLEGG